MIKAEVSLYPIETEEVDGTVLESLQEIHGGSLQYDLGSLNTFFTGESQEVFQALKRLYEASQKPHNEVVMVVTISTP